MCLIEKNCFTCKLNKPINQFAKCKKAKDGYGYSCKNCISLKYRGVPHKGINNPELDPYYNVPIGCKRCTKCRITKSLDEY